MEPGEPHPVWCFCSPMWLHLLKMLLVSVAIRVISLVMVYDLGIPWADSGGAYCGDIYLCRK